MSKKKLIIEVDDEDLTAFLGLPMDTPSLSAYHVREALKKGTECKKGKWEAVKESTFIQYEPSEYQCPFCHTIRHVKTNYCPACGADLRGEESK